MSGLRAGRAARTLHDPYVAARSIYRGRTSGAVQIDQPLSWRCRLAAGGQRVPVRYGTAQITVKTRYRLSVIPPERGAMARILPVLVCRLSTWRGLVV